MQIVQARMGNKPQYNRAVKKKMKLQTIGWSIPIFDTHQKDPKKAI